MVRLFVVIAFSKIIIPPFKNDDFHIIIALY